MYFHRGEVFKQRKNCPTSARSLIGQLNLLEYS